MNALIGDLNDAKPVELPKNVLAFLDRDGMGAPEAKGPFDADADTTQESMLAAASGYFLRAYSSFHHADDSDENSDEEQRKRAAKMAMGELRKKYQQSLFNFEQAQAEYDLARQKLDSARDEVNAAETAVVAAHEAKADSAQTIEEANQDYEAKREAVEGKTVTIDGKVVHYDAASNKFVDEHGEDVSEELLKESEDPTAKDMYAAYEAQLERWKLMAGSRGADYGIAIAEEKLDTAVTSEADAEADADAAKEKLDNAETEMNDAQEDLKKAENDVVASNDVTNTSGLTGGLIDSPQASLSGAFTVAAVGTQPVAGESQPALETSEPAQTLKVAQAGQQTYTL